VIGGGSAGATVAARLSEESRFSVLLLEAGLDEPTGTQIPSFFFNFIGSEIDWQYNTESEDEACLNKEHRKCYWPRGKVCRIKCERKKEGEGETANANSSNLPLVRLIQFQLKS